MSAAPTITRTWTGSVVLTFPYDQWLVEALKAEIPAHARSYDPVTKAWTVTPAYVDTAARLMLATFADVDLVDQSRTPPADRAPHTAAWRNSITRTVAGPRRPCNASTPQPNRSRGAGHERNPRSDRDHRPRRTPPDRRGPPADSARHPRPRRA